MTRVTITIAMILVVTGSAISQDSTFHGADGARQFAVKASGQPTHTSSRYGNSIWNNFAATGLFASMTPSYIWLDWGKMYYQGNDLPDEVVDGFRFAYGTNDTSTAGLSWNIYFFDSCTGWGDRTIVAEAEFSFTGLPNALNFPPANWIWEITVDLEGSGFEFLMGDEIGIAQQLVSALVNPTIAGPCLTQPPNWGGNGPTGTEDAFTMYASDWSYLGTWWFSSYPSPFTSFRTELLGGNDPAGNIVYSGIGLQGNDAALYTIGSWIAGDTVRFLLRKNGMDQASWIVASTTFYWPPRYLPWYDITLGPRIPFLAVLPMSPDPTGDFASQTFPVGPNAMSWKIYMQGAITDVFNGGPLEPLELSNSLIAK